MHKMAASAHLRCHPDRHTEGIEAFEMHSLEASRSDYETRPQGTVADFRP